MDTIRMSFVIPREEYDALGLLAEMNDRTRSAEVREALRARLAEAARAPQNDERRPGKRSASDESPSESATRAAG